MMHLLPSLLYTILGTAVCGDANVAVCPSGAACDEETDGLGMAQLRRHHAAPQYIPLGFELFMQKRSAGAIAAPFRLTIDTKVLGKTFKLLLDTGSGVLALCNGTSSADGTFIPATQPMPAGTPTGTYDVELYGEDGHGYTSAVYNGSFAIGSVSSKAGGGSQYQVMMSKRVERSNSCGIPLPGTGATRMEGIFGFGGPHSRSEMFLCDKPYADLIPGGNEFPQCPKEDKVFHSTWYGPFTSLEGSKQFGISINGASGALYMGSGAKALLQTTYADSKPVRAAMEWQNGLYDYSLKSYGAKVAGVPLVDSTLHCLRKLCRGYVDTGNPFTSIPGKTFQALEAHFATSKEPATFEIGMAGEEAGSDSTLSFEISPVMWAHKVFLFTESYDFVIGLGAWFWYEHVHFDVEEKAFAFIPRSNMALVHDYFSEGLMARLR